MKYLLSLLVVCLLVSCGTNLKNPNGNNNGGNDFTPPTQLPSGSIRHPLDSEGIQRPLVNRYYRLIQHDDGHQEVNSQDFKYQPRQSTFQNYEGWDILSTPWPWAPPSNDKWLNLSLNRDARLVIVISEWAKPEDEWLSDWKKGSTTVQDHLGDTLNYQTFTKDFSKGEITIPHLFELQYSLLIAEKGGVASAEPSLPEGITERPKPNKTCPAWLHDSWTAKGLDDRDYQSWHPQIDPIYWCYYGHDHGSDPSAIGYAPAFRYIAYLNNNQQELYEGFKGFTIIDKANDIGWYINAHTESGVITRVCNRVHTIVVYAVKLSTKEKLVHLGYKGDFGAAIGTFNGADDQIIQSSDCPQGAIAKETKASRRIRIGADNHNYERWDGGASRDLGMEFPEWSTGMGIDIRNPATSCKDIACDSLVINDSNSDMRTINFVQLSLEYTSLIKALDATDGKANDGYFYTDVYGKFNGDTSKDVVKQYIKPGFKGMLDGHYSTQDPWRAIYEKDGHAPGLELEDALGTIN
jgi:hypothetical protein